MIFLSVLACCFLLHPSVLSVNVEAVVQGHRVVRSTPSLDAAEELLEKFGSGNKMNLSEVKELFKSIGMSALNDNDTKAINSNAKQACFSSQYFFGMYSKNDGNINKTDLMDLCPAVLYQMTKSECRAEVEHVADKKPKRKEKPAKAWGFGFLLVTIISCCSLIGAFVVPMMNKPFYKKMLMCMVSLAVGVLGGSGVFHLIPSALGFPLGDQDNSYLWKCAMIFVGLYVFLVMECAMKLYVRSKDTRRKKHVESTSTILDEEKPGVNSESICISVSPTYGQSHAHGNPNGTHGIIANEHVGDNEIPNKTDEHHHIATVAWMIIIGDGLHNFIDGLAIGASFSTSVLDGMSTSLAIISEELPHELGDFAILLNSGLTYKQAMFANFMSACLCYVGLIIGLVLGYQTHAVKYIYGIAGGMFVYISLVDMLPEAVEMAYAISGSSTLKAVKMLAVVNLIIIFGFGVMLILALYGSSIQI